MCRFLPFCERRNGKEGGGWGQGVLGQGEERMEDRGRLRTDSTCQCDFFHLLSSILVFARIPPCPVRGNILVGDAWRCRRRCARCLAAAWRRRLTSRAGGGRRR